MITPPSPINGGGGRMEISNIFGQNLFGIWCLEFGIFMIFCFHLDHIVIHLLPSSSSNRFAAGGPQDPAG